MPLDLNELDWSSITVSQRAAGLGWVYDVTGYGYTIQSTNLKNNVKFKIECTDRELSRAHCQTHHNAVRMSIEAFVPKYSKPEPEAQTRVIDLSTTQ